MSKSYRDTGVSKNGKGNASLQRNATIEAIKGKFVRANNCN